MTALIVAVIIVLLPLFAVIAMAVWWSTVLLIFFGVCWLLNLMSRGEVDEPV